MKKLIIILLLLIAFQTESQSQVQLIPQYDKTLHFIGGAAIGYIFFLAVYNFTGNKKIATWVSLGVGSILFFTKEFTDSEFSWGDIGYDYAGLGAVVGGFRITININNKHHNKKLSLH